METNYFDEIPGTRVRRQYFDLPLKITVIMAVLLTELFTIFNFSISDFYFDEWIEFVFESTGWFLIPISIFLLLSVLNKTVFGEVVCVVNQQGIYYKYGHAKWENIAWIKHNLPFIHKTVCVSEYIQITLKSESRIDVEHIPKYVLMVAKNKFKKIKVRGDAVELVYLLAFVIMGIIFFFS